MNKEDVFNILYGKEKWEVYRKFKEIEESIDKSDELYDYIDKIINMLSEERSCVRVRSFRIICKLSKYDRKNKINDNIDCMLKILDADRPTSVRQCLSAINILLLNKPELSNRIKEKLVEIDYSKYNDNMSPLIQKDINSILGNL